jgi:hypothetical protein
MNQFWNEMEIWFGVVDEVFMNIHHPWGALFLLANRCPRGNIYALPIVRATSVEERLQLEEQNRHNTLDWSSSALFYLNGDIIYFDHLIDPFELIQQGASRTLRQFYCRSKLLNIINGFKTRGIAANRIFVTGVRNQVEGNCRDKAINFIKNVIRSRMLGRECNNYFLVEVVEGPREPSANRGLITLNSF